MGCIYSYRIYSRVSSVGVPGYCLRRYRKDTMQIQAVRTITVRRSASWFLVGCSRCLSVGGCRDAGGSSLRDALNQAQKHNIDVHRGEYDVLNTVTS